MISDTTSAFGELELILSSWKDQLAGDYDAYLNHIKRVVYFCQMQKDLTEDELKKIQIAAVFHDLGLWVKSTFDYLEPSVVLATDFLDSINKDEWREEISLMIRMHHKFTRFKDTNFPLVEVFRKADWIDVSRGRMRFKLPKSEIQHVINTIPNLGFHKKLITLTRQQFRKTPLKPLPMMRW